MQSFVVLKHTSLHNLPKIIQLSKISTYPPVELWPRSIVDAFAQVCAAAPNAAALRADGITVTYAALDRASDRLARAIERVATRSMPTIGVGLPRSPDMAIAMLAVLKAGGTYVPLDPSHPPERLRAMLVDGNAELTIARADFPASGLPDIPRLDPDAMAGDGVPRHVPGSGPRPEPGPDTLAYAMFTSGSTGRPKAVGITHANVLALALRPSFVDIAPGSRVLHGSSPLFDATTFEIWGTLLNGACVVIAPPGPPDPAKLEALIASERVDTMWLTAGLFQHLAAGRPSLFRTVKTVLSGGDVVSPAAVRAAWAAAPDLRVINAYGPTETTTLVTAHVVTEADVMRERLPIGRPIRGTSVHILASDGQPVPTGEAGEICISGASVGAGYLGQPALTAQRFPIGLGGERMYRTGDLGRYLPSGEIDFLGRLDRQIKLRGYRIEPGEIEAALLRQPDLAQAYIAVRDIGTDRQLVAYVVPKPGSAATDSAAIAAALANALPDYMIPSVIVSLPALPLTENGKVDSAALPMPSRTTRQGEPPRDGTEALLCRLFGEATDTAAVARDDDFFGLGGSSLSALCLAAGYVAATGDELPLDLVYRNPTPAGLAQALGVDGQGIASSLLPLRRTGTRPPLFCIHPASGMAINYKPLAEALASEPDQDRPVWGLQSPPLDGPNPPPASIAEMATRYCAAVRTVQPHGPYALLGWSLGGIVAQEMACQFEEQGETVAILALLDTDPPDRAAEDRGGHAGFARNALVRMSQKDTAGQTRRAQMMVAQAAARDLIPADTPVSWAIEILRQVAWSTGLLGSHTPRVCHCRVLSAEAEYGLVATGSTRAWARHCLGSIDTVRLPTTHQSVLSPQALPIIVEALYRLLP